MKISTGKRLYDFIILMSDDNFKFRIQNASIVIFYVYLQQFSDAIIVSVYCTLINISISRSRSATKSKTLQAYEENYYIMERINLDSICRTIYA